MDYNYEFDYQFWHLDPYVLGKGEECFNKLAGHFGITDNNVLSDVENAAKDLTLDALAYAAGKSNNPFTDSDRFVLANLINFYKIECLIEYICDTQQLNRNDFRHDVYHDGALLQVEYKGEVIA